ncbi:hypothetical protein, partial [Citrobacter freundii]|uniref:hypothetical protein n=1 Tax=Citrobacter freundii TaxID=546 RepID=UPI001CD1DD4D
CNYPIYRTDKTLHRELQRLTSPIERHPRKGSSLLNRPLKQYLQTPFTNLNILFLALRLLLASIIEGGLKNLCKITHPVKSE